MIAAVAVCCFRLFPARDVTVLHDGTSSQVSATFDVRDEALTFAGVAVEPGDRVVLAESADHSSLAVLRARDVVIDSDGYTTSLRTQSATVEGALADAGVALGANDRVYINGRLTTPRGPLAAAVAASRTAGINPVTGPGDERPPTVTVSVVRARPVTVYLDGTRIDVQSSAPTVQAVLAELGIMVREGDLVRPGLDAQISAGLAIRLAKARTISVTIDGKTQSLYTQARTVGEVFALLNMTVGPNDLVSHPLSRTVSDGMQILLGRTIETDEEVVSDIPPGTEYRTDPTLPEGERRTIQGAPGQKRTLYRVVYKNGAEQSRVAIEGSEEILVAPIPTVVVTGTRNAPSRPVAVANPAPTEPPAPEPEPEVPAAGAPTGRTMVVVATWYNETHGDKSRDDPWYGITSTGQRLAYGMCATDPSVIPTWTRFHVPGYGDCVAADVGGGIVGHHIDLAFPEAMGTPSWGVQTVTITFLD